MIDINVWLAATWDQHPQHEVAARWFGTIDQAALLFCRFTMLGLLRLLTNEQVMGDSTVSVSGALEVYDQWRRDPRVDLAPEARGAEEAFRRALAPHAAVAATKAIADSYLVGFADSAGARLVTFDRALAAVARSRRITTVLLEPSRTRRKR